ncbi:TIGR00341 family protein [Candidatus Falkowbacteria bacterium]|jgi:uncharacterized hydrophobic protein (TIGR00271 family)|nr:TIGR00341 family protein [Candidatus Falkowbacteria bacterium]MBT4432969.1 TIGR00341 family protein [Candidatus Falkowbacteria bacterium]
MLIQPEKVTKIQKRHTFEALFRDSTPSYDFFLMLILSAILVAIGLLINNAVVVIGGMLVAPILSPILSFSMGMVVGDVKLMKRSGEVILQSILIVVVVSLVISFLTINRELTPEIFSRAHPSLAYFLIALFSGLAASYSLVRPNLSEKLSGVAISVALIPPLASLGIAFSFFDVRVIVGSLGLFALNLVGIILAALVVFAIFKFYEVKESIEKKIKAEERIIKEEEKEKTQEKIEEIEKQVKEATEFLKENKKK